MNKDVKKWFSKVIYFFKCVYIVLIVINALLSEVNLFLDQIGLK